VVAKSEVEAAPWNTVFAHRSQQPYTPAPADNILHGDEIIAASFNNHFRIPRIF
jgi:hypothetical protein